MGSLSRRATKLARRLCALALQAAAAAAASQVWRTSQAGERLAPLGAVQWLDSAPPGTITTVQADFVTRQQEIIGFGGAFTESAAFNFMKLAPDARVRAAKLLFGTHDVDGGNSLSMGRIAINSPDFALSDYSYANETGDYNLSSFDHKLARDGLYVVPMIKACQLAAPGPLKLFATPWSPPAWMKVAFGGDIPRMDGSTLPGLVGECNATWALYFSYWFTAMKAEYGLDFWGMTPQNEPTAINSTGVQWDACGYTAPGMLAFLKTFLLPVMRRDHPLVRIMAFDHNNDHVEEWTDTLYADEEVKNATFATAIHWYSGSISSLNNSHYKHPDMPILHTEGCMEATGREDWSHAENYAVQMLQFLQAWSSSFTDWNLMLDASGGPHHANGGLDAPLIVVNSTSFYVQPFYYAFGHFSRFLPEHAQVNGAMVFSGADVVPPEGHFFYTLSSSLGVLAATMRNRTRVVLVVNAGAAAVEQAALKVRRAPGAAFRFAMLDVPAHSVQTITFEDDVEV